MMEFGIPKADKIVKFKSQQTIKTTPTETVEEWTMNVYSVNDLRARRRARRWVRANTPAAFNVLTPEVQDRDEQSTIRDFFENSIDFKYREVTVTVVKQNVVNA